MSRKNKNRIVLLFSVLFILFFGGAFPLLGQQNSFANYMQTGAALNPALPATQNLIGANILYRNQQYGNGIVMQRGHLQFQYALLNKAKTKRWGGIGLVLQNDRIMQGGPYSYYSVQPSFSYNVSTGKSFIALGIQSSFNQVSFNPQTFTTGSQWIPNQGFNAGSDLGESFIGQQANYISLGSGALWYNENERGERKNYFGVAIHSLNQPYREYTGNKERIPIQITGLGGYQLLQINQHDLRIDGLMHYTEIEQFWGAGPSWRYHFADKDPFDPFTAGSIAVLAKYFSSERISLGTQVAQRNFAVGFSVDLHLANSAQMPTTEFAFSVFKNLGMKKKKEMPESEFELGTTRDFGENNFRDQPVRVIEKEYKANVSNDFSFELRKNFNYGFNETTLNEDAKAYLEDIATMLKANAALKLRVTGHTDNVGTDEANQVISEERAFVVRNFLATQGIAMERLSYQGKGASEPIAPNTTEANRARNRRVEFLIYATKD